MNGHPRWELLNDYRDGTLPSDACKEVEAHLETCAECDRTLARLGAMLTAAPEINVVVEPPEQAWEAIRLEVERKKVVSLPNTSCAPPRRTRVPVIAAAVVLIAASSIVTMRMVRRSEPTPSAVTIPADFAGVEVGLLATARELEASLDSGQIDPSATGAPALRGSLEILDAGIAEARQALVDDPASPVLRQILAKNYQRKIDVLRRAAARTVGN